MNKSTLLGLTSIFFSFLTYSQCDITATASQMEITCGESVDLSAFGSSNGTVVLDEDFNGGGFGPGWGSTPGAVNFTNPCDPGNGTPHAWMDNNTSVPRTLQSASFDLSGATAGVTICFDLLFAEQGDAAPCEGPDEPDEGVYFQYSTDGGATWIDINYFDPNGGNDPMLTNWNTWCFTLPPGALTANTIFRWHQTADSGADYDHWGIDNVQIFQNDVNAEITWLHDGYSYGVGQPGGVNPNPVSPTSTTTYTAQIVTGTGDVCTADVTVVVLPPNYDVTLNAAPTTICNGDCSTITGTGQVVVDPGGIETYENNELGLITGTPGLPGIPPFIPPTPGDITADMNINVVGLNEPTITPGMITTVCINDFSIFPLGGGTTSLADCEIILTCPSGTQITLANIGDLSGTTITNMCFQVGAANVGTGSAPYTGTWDPAEPFDNLVGCDAEGVWNLTITGEILDFTLPLGSIGGWSITFDDPPVYQPVCYNWTPATGLSVTNDINTTACPTSTTTYNLEVSNCVPGCPTQTETVTITVDPCGGCTPPNMVINTPAAICAPGTIDLSTAIGGASDPATVTYHASNADATADINPIAAGVTTSGTYFIRAEDPSDPTCFTIEQVTVTINPSDDPSFTFNDFCEGTANGASGIATPGGTFAFNPIPGGGETIDPSTGEITGGTNGSSYTVEYTTNGACPATTTQTVNVTGLTYTAAITPEACGAGDGEIVLTPTSGSGPYTFSIDGGTTTQGTGTFSGLTAGNYNIVITDAGGCSVTGTENVGSQGGPTIDNMANTDPSCPGACDGEISVTVSGGTPPYSYQWYDAGNNPIGTNADNITGLCAGDYSVEVSDAAGGGPTILNSNSDFEAGSGAGCDCPTGYNCSNDAGQVFDGNHPVYAPGDNGCVTGATNYSSSLGANSGTGYVYFYAGADAISTGPYAFTGGETVEICVNYSGPQGGGASGQNTANSHFTFGIDGVSVTPDVTVPTNTGWTQYCFTTTMTAGNHTFEILSGGAAQYAIWFDDFTISIPGGGAGCPTTQATTLVDPVAADPSFTFADYCSGAVNGPANIATPGGTFAFNPAPGGGETIDPTTGVITGGIAGNTYTVEYTTAAPCPESSTVDVNVINCCDLAVTTVVTDETCDGQDDGAIDFTITGSDTYDVIIDGNVEFNDVTAGTQNWTGQADGTYAVQIVNIADPTCDTTFNITINQGTVVTIDTENATDITDCLNPDGTFTVTSTGGTSYELYTSAGALVTTNATGTFTGLNAGDYYVIALAGACSAQSSTLSIANASAPPAPVAGTDATYCSGAMLTDLTANASSGGTLNWYSDAGLTTNIGTGTTLTPNATLGATTYYVTETVAGCESPASTVTVTINPIPAAPTAGTDATYCEGDPMNDLTATAGIGGTLNWYSDAGLTTNIGTGTTLTPGMNLGATDYYVTETLNGCTSPASMVTVTINANPVITAEAATDNTSCASPDGTVTITANGSSYELFDASNNSVSTNATGAFTGLAPGDYYVVVSNGNCTVTGATLTINDLATGASNTINASACAGDTYTFADGTTQTLNATMTYNSTFTMANGCDSIVTENVTVFQPTTTIIDTSICEGGNYTSVGDAANFVNVLADFQHTSTLTSSTGCDSIIIENVSIIPLATIDIGFDQNLCFGETMTITATSNAGTPTWSNGATSMSIDYTGTVDTFFIAEVNGPCGSASDTIFITVLPPPDIDAGADVEVPLGNTTDLSVTSNSTIVNWSWSPSTFLDCDDCPDPTVGPTSTVTYIVEGMDENGCIGYDTITVVIDGEVQIYIPNIFSPNNDGENDLFRVYGATWKHYRMEIYNRWGGLVWKSEDPNVEWDGRHKNGEECPQAVFVYKFWGVTNIGLTFDRTGNVMLTR